MRSAQRQVELRRLGNRVIDIPGYRSSGKIGVASKRCTTVPVAPPGDGKIRTPVFTLFRPLSPAFSFADVDSYGNVIQLLFQWAHSQQCFISGLVG